MLRNTKSLMGYAVHAIDGAIGHVRDFYFDDETWSIRYFIVDTGSWLSSRKVLISPIAITHPSVPAAGPGWMEKVLGVSITREQVSNSPDIDTDKPVTRQHEMRYLRYYGLYPYWGAVYGPVKADTAARRDDETHLRRFRALLKYHIDGTDGDIGHVQGLLVDDDTWAIRYLIVDTNNWLDHPVLIASQWIERVRWSDATVCINLTQRGVKDAPCYDPSAVLGATAH